MIFSVGIIKAKWMGEMVGGSLKYIDLGVVSFSGVTQEAYDKRLADKLSEIKVC